MIFGPFPGGVSVGTATTDAAGTVDGATDPVTGDDSDSSPGGTGSSDTGSGDDGTTIPDPIQGVVDRL